MQRHLGPHFGQQLINMCLIGAVLPEVVDEGPHSMGARRFVGDMRQRSGVEDEGADGRRGVLLHCGVLGQREKIIV